MDEDKLVLGLWGLIFMAWFYWRISPWLGVGVIVFIVWMIYRAGRINRNW